MCKDGHNMGMSPTDLHLDLDLKQEASIFGDVGGAADGQ